MPFTMWKAFFHPPSHIFSKISSQKHKEHEKHNEALIEAFLSCRTDRFIIFKNSLNVHYITWGKK